MTDKHDKEVDIHTGTETTGHEWDGIKELNTPLPRWWLYIWYATIVWAVVYMVLMPAIPGLPGANGATAGLRNHSDRDIVAADVASLRDARSAQAATLMAASLQDITTDHELQQFALAMGESAFGDNCATCHGAGGRGALGYPSLADDVWLWGGSLDDIQQTIAHGIRSDVDFETRTSEMPAFGRDGYLSEHEIDEVTQYVLQISGHEEFDASQAALGVTLFEEQCAACHGSDGKGDRIFGAPDLTDAEWLYGDSPAAVRETIYNARNSSMPAWNERLDEATIKALAVYVHTRGGGE